MTMKDSLKKASELVDTWPDWKLDTVSLNQRNKRRAAGEQLPKPTKDEQRITELERALAAERKRAADLAEQMEGARENADAIAVRLDIDCEQMNDAETWGATTAAIQTLQKQLEQAISERDAAKKILDNAMQLLRETGFRRINPNHPIWENYNASDAARAAIPEGGAGQ